MTPDYWPSVAFSLLVISGFLALIALVTFVSLCKKIVTSRCQTGDDTSDLLDSWSSGSPPSISNISFVTSHERHHVDHRRSRHGMFGLPPPRAIVVDPGPPPPLYEIVVKNQDCFPLILDAEALMSINDADASPPTYSESLILLQTKQQPAALEEQKVNSEAKDYFGY